MSQIDVRELMDRYSMSDLVRFADEYFSIHADKPRLMQKPFNDIEESAEAVLTFIHVVQGLGLPPGSLILDFGAGSCWTSRLLAGFGYRVIASDVSEAALAIGRELMNAHPLFVDHHPVQFLPFDGFRLALENGSVDGICCISALHHTPNPQDIIREFGRVLKPWGVAGASEPGPNHSKTPASQLEMSRFNVIENDVVIEDLWQTAQEAGFTAIDLAVFNPILRLMGLNRFNGFLHGDRPVDWENDTRNLMVERRLFFLEKGVGGIGSSNSSEGLAGQLRADKQSIEGRSRDRVRVEIVATNTGTSLWRPSNWWVGPVRVGPQITYSNGTQAYLDRWMMPTMPRRGVLPGQEITVVGDLELPSVPGRYKISFQLVAEYVAWFGQTISLEVTVR